MAGLRAVVVGRTAAMCIMVMGMGAYMAGLRAIWLGLEQYGWAWSNMAGLGAIWLGLEL